jgi:hypothetical protein
LRNLFLPRWTDRFDVCSAVAQRSLTRLLGAVILFACTACRTDQSAETINKPFTVSGVRVDPDSLNTYLAAHRGFTSRGGEMRCAYRPLGQRGTRVFVWAVCSELLAVDDHLVNGSGMSLPAAFEIRVDSDRARIVAVEVPADGSGYGASIRRIFPPTTWRAIFSNGTRDQPAAGLERQLRVEAAARFGLPLAAASAPRRHDPPPPYTQDSGVFALVVRGDTTVLDEFVRRSNLLEGVVRPLGHGAKFGWGRYRVEFSPSGEATRSQLWIGRVGTSPDSAAVSTHTITFGPDSIVDQWPNRMATRVPYVRGTVPLFGPSIAMLQEVVRRASRMPPAMRELGVPVYPVWVDARMGRVRAHWITRDTLTLSWGDSAAARYVVSGWRILSGENGDSITLRRPVPYSAATLDSSARRVVDFLRGNGSFDQIELKLSDTVTLFVSPEGGGGRATFVRERLRQPSAWRVRSGGRVFSLAPPAGMTKLTTKVGRHFNCKEQPLASKFPRLAQLPHVGAVLEPENARSCLQTWNVTFVFDTTSHPRVVAAVYDQWEW